MRETPVEPWTLTLRVPGWADGATLRTPDGATTARSGRTASERRAWQAGDRLTLELPSEVRLVHPDHRVDAIRGSIAFERGPLVYAFETADLPPGTSLEDVAVRPSAEVRTVPRPDLGAGVLGVVTTAATPPDLQVQAIPYFTWGNRNVEAMRVWIPAGPG